MPDGSLLYREKVCLVCVCTGFGGLCYNCVSENSDVPWVPSALEPMPAFAHPPPTSGDDLSRVQNPLSHPTALPRGNGHRGVPGEGWWLEFLAITGKEVYNPLGGRVGYTPNAGGTTASQPGQRHLRQAPGGHALFHPTHQYATVCKRHVHHALR